jgi:cullin 1
MYNDVTISRDINDEFIRENNNLPVDFSIQVLSTGSWPLTPPSSNFVTPLVLAECEKRFLECYSKKHNGRKIVWLHQYSKGEIFGKGFKPPSGNKLQTYHFTCSTYQMSVLLLFNESDSISVSEMISATQLTEQLLIQTLAVLSKARLLKPGHKVTAENPVTGSSKFELNKDYKNNRVKVSLLSRPVDQEKESQSSYAVINDDRNLQIQVCFSFIFC